MTCLCAVGLSTSALCAPSLQQNTLSPEAYFRRPKLVLVIVIDQFRADFLTRFEPQFLPSRNTKGQRGGFRFLMKGSYFPFAEYEQLQNMTCVGHATIMTGAYPYAHRISTNEWYDANSGKKIYCVDDEKAALVGSTSTSPGVSPKLLKATTVGDELKAAFAKSRVVGVALKDRSAVLLTGHRTDLAIWFDAKDYKWISSEYYLPQQALPSWVDALNKKISARKDQVSDWSLPTASQTKQKITWGSKDSLRTPIGLELTTDAALSAVQEMKLGMGDTTDILAVSYSTHDLLGHSVGTHAPEMEALTLAEDRTLAALFKALDERIPGGMTNVLVVLTGDHGAAPPLALSESGRIEAGSFDAKNVVTKMNETLRKKFGDPGDGRDWVLFVQSLNFYLNRTAMTKNKIAPADIESEAKAFLLKETFTDGVVARSEHEKGLYPAGLNGNFARLTYVPENNGDLILIPKPFYAEFKDPSPHVTGHTYDRFVPLLLVGPNVKSGVHAKHVRIVDLAPTLSFLLGLVPPSRSEGRVLEEAIYGQ